MSEEIEFEVGGVKYGFRPGFPHIYYVDDNIEHLVYLSVNRVFCGVNDLNSPIRVFYPTDFPFQELRNIIDNLIELINKNDIDTETIVSIVKDTVDSVESSIITEDEIIRMFIPNGVDSIKVLYPRIIVNNEENVEHLKNKGIIVPKCKKRGKFISLSDHITIMWEEGDEVWFTHIGYVNVENDVIEVVYYSPSSTDFEVFEVKSLDL